MAEQNTDFGRVADDLRRAAQAFALLTSSATVFGASLNAFREFNASLTQTNTIAQGNVATYNQMSKAVRDFSRVTTVTSTEAISALQNLAQAGFTVEESLSAMTGVLLLASATMTDVGVASDLISSNIRAFGLAASDTSRVANLFTAAMNNSLATVDKLTFALRQVAPVADIAGLSIEETTAYLNELFNIGLRGEQAGTSLRNVILRLTRPTGEAAKILREYGIATIDATGNLRDFEAILQDINRANLNTGQLATIFENEALAGALQLMKSVTVANDELTSSYRDQLGAITGTQAALIATVKNLDTFDGSLKLLKNNVNDVFIALGEELAPTIRLLAEYMIELIQQFRDLDPETQQLIKVIAGVAAGAALLLATMNALMLLFGRSVGIIGGLVAGLFKVEAGSNKASMGMKGLAAGVAFGALEISGANDLIRNSFGNTGVAIAGAALGAVAFLPGGPIILGLIAISALVVKQTAEWLNYEEAAAKAADAAGRAAGAKTQSKEFDASGFTDSSAEIEALFRQIDALQNSGLIDAISKNDLPTAIAGLEASQKLAQEIVLRANDQIAETVKELNEMSDYLERRNDAFARATALNDPFIFQEFQRENSEQEGAYEEILKRRDAAAVERIKAFDTIKAGNDKEVAQLDKYLRQFSEGKIQLDEIFSDLQEPLQNILKGQDEEFFKRLAEFLAADADGTITNEELIAAIFTDENLLQSDGLPIAQLQDYLERRNQAQVRKVSADLKSIEEKLKLENDKLRIAAQEFIAENAMDQGEALAAGLNASNATLELDLQETVDKFVSDFGDEIGQIVQQGNAEVQKAINKTLKAHGYGDLQNEGLDELFGGKGLIEAINARVDENTSPEELARIGAEEAAKYKATMLAVLQNIKRALGETVSPEQLAQLENITKLALDNIGIAVTNGASSSQLSQIAIQERIDREAEAVKREADKKVKEAREAVKKSREIADLFTDLAAEINDARQTFNDATRGFSISDRIEVSLEFDIEGINAEYDKKLLDLKRKLEDAELDFSGTPQQLEVLRTQYKLLIDETTKARDAEIAASSSFTSQMERRSAAIDLFIRDLEDLAFDAKDTFTSVGAGVAAAFADYQKNLITLVDISRDAITGLLDTITTGIGDFIFDNENAWESFKKNMLNISRQVFEGFTKGLIQQGISSLTGGGGSLISNSLQPGKGPGTGTPGVGSGGLLGKLFPGLAGAFGKSAGGQSDGPLGPVLDNVAQQTEAVYTRNLNEIDQVLQTFSAGLSQAMQGAVGLTSGITGNGALQTAGGALGGVGGALGSIFPGVGAATGAIGRIGGMLGGAGGGIMGALGGLLGNAGASANGIPQGAIKPGSGQALSIAGRMLGMNEKDQRNAIQQYLQDGGVNLDPAVTPWCAAFVNSTLAQSGLAGSGSNLARSLLNVGTPVSVPAPGDVAVFSRGNDGVSGHTGFFQGYNPDGSIQVLGGNQSNAVTSQAYSANQLLGFRRVGGGAANGVPAGMDPAAAIPGAAGAGGDPLAASAEQFSQMFQSFMQSIVGTVNQFGSQFAQAFNAAIQAVGGTGSVQYKPIQLAAGTGGAGGLGGALGGMGGGIGGLLGGLFGGGRGGGLGGIFSNLLGSLFDEGGYTGPGGKKTPKGIVHAGEFVMDQNATRQFYPLLDAIHKGQVKPQMANEVMAAMLGRKSGMGYMDGGFVGSLGSFAGRGLSPSVQSGAVPGTSIREGDKISLNVNYNIRGGQTPDRFSRSASQHAKQLMAQIEKAKKNT